MYTVNNDSLYTCLGSIWWGSEIQEILPKPVKKSFLGAHDLKIRLALSIVSLCTNYIDFENPTKLNLLMLSHFFDPFSYQNELLLKKDPSSQDDITKF